TRGGVHRRTREVFCHRSRPLYRWAFVFPRARARPMHPAYSVILFTTASGAGLGLLAWLALLGLLDAVPADRWLGVAGLAVAFLLVTGGLIASTSHLGRPERVWRAFSQWRTS